MTCSSFGLNLCFRQAASRSSAVRIWWVRQAGNGLETQGPRKGREKREGGKGQEKVKPRPPRSIRSKIWVPGWRNSWYTRLQGLSRPPADQQQFLRDVESSLREAPRPIPLIRLSLLLSALVKQVFESKMCQSCLTETKAGCMRKPQKPFFQTAFSPLEEKTKQKTYNLSQAIFSQHARKIRLTA